MTTEQDAEDDVVTHEVPTHIMAEDTFMFGLTLFNMMMSMGVFGAAGAVYLMPFMVFLPSVVRLILVGSILVIGLPCVLVKVEGRPFTLYLMDMAQYVISPKQYTGRLTTVTTNQPSEIIMAAVAAREAKAVQKSKGRRFGTRIRATKRAMKYHGPLALFGVRRRTAAQTARQALGADFDYERAIAGFEEEFASRPGNVTQAHSEYAEERDES